MNADAELTLAETECALAESVVAFEDHQRDLLTVAGPEAAVYLQGQVSQDIEALAIGQSARSFVLEPQGKVDAWFRVTRVDGETFVIDIDEGHGEALKTRLERFKLRTKADITLRTVHWVAVRGPQSADLEPEDVELRVEVDWRGGAGVDLFDPVFRPRRAGTVVPLGDHRALAAWRIRHGMPHMGAELTPETIPNEVGVNNESVSFTKGCYTGQELVARVDSRGNNTPRRLVGVSLAAVPGGATDEASLADVLESGVELRRNGDVVGRLTSLAPLADSSSVALAYLKRGVDVGSGFEAIGPDGTTTAATVADLPF